MFLKFLDDLVHYQDTTLPNFSALTYLYLVCLISAFVIATDSFAPKQKKTKAKTVRFAGMSDFNSVSTPIPLYTLAHVGHR